MAVLWGVLVFGTWPDPVAWTGIALIGGAGLYTLWREARLGRGVAAAASGGEEARGRRRQGKARGPSSSTSAAC
jgi:hypothetical protein